VHVRHPRLGYESHATGLDRDEVGALLATVGLRTAAEHALISLTSARAREAFYDHGDTTGSTAICGCPGCRW